MRQLFYVSSRSPAVKDVSVGNILMTSRRNNDAAGVTGLLYTDGVRFLQVLEGEPGDVEATFLRIRADPRHHAVVILSDRVVTEREFGAWSMAYRLPTDEADTFDARVERMLAGANDSVRATFQGLIATRRVA